MRSLEARTKIDKVKVVAKARLKAIKEYKASSKFRVEVTEASSVAFGYGFDAYKALLVHLFPKLDVN